MSDIWHRVSPNPNQIGVRAYIMQRRSSCLEADNFSRLLSQGRHEANRILGQQIMMPYPAEVIEIDIDGRTQKVRPVCSWVLQSNTVVVEGPGGIAG